MKRLKAIISVDGIHGQLFKSNQLIMSISQEISGSQITAMYRTITRWFFNIFSSLRKTTKFYEYTKNAIKNMPKTQKYIMHTQLRE